jgi:N-methylhydantoinase B
LAGGEAGTTSQNVLVTLDGQRRILPSKLVLEIATGTVWQHTTAGGGGWGDPARRDCADIDHDVFEGKLGAAKARQLYGWAPQSPEASPAPQLVRVKAESV